MNLYNNYNPVNNSNKTIFTNYSSIENNKKRNKNYINLKYLFKKKSVKVFIVLIKNYFFYLKLNFFL